MFTSEKSIPSSGNVRVFLDLQLLNNVVALDLTGRFMPGHGLSAGWT